MAVKKIDNDCLKAIGDKLRAVQFNDTTYTVDEIPDAIRNLQDGVGYCNFSWDNLSTIYVDISDDMASKYSVYITFRVDRGSQTTIRWGDGTSSLVSEPYPQTSVVLHHYETGGHYEITINVSEITGMAAEGATSILYRGPALVPSNWE